MSSKDISLKCVVNVHRYSSAGVCGLCVGIFSSFAMLAFVCRLCVPCKCAKNSVGLGRQSHVSLNLSRILFRVTYNGPSIGAVGGFSSSNRPAGMFLLNEITELLRNSQRH